MQVLAWIYGDIVVHVFCRLWLYPLPINIICLRTEVKREHIYPVCVHGYSSSKKTSREWRRSRARLLSVLSVVFFCAALPVTLRRIFAYSIQSRMVLFHNNNNNPTKYEGAFLIPLFHIQLHSSQLSSTPLLPLLLHGSQWAPTLLPYKDSSFPFCIFLFLLLLFSLSLSPPFTPPP